MKENDKAKLLVLFCGDDDPAVQRAACGGLAILSMDHSEQLAEKILKVRILQQSYLSTNFKLNSPV